MSTLQKIFNRYWITIALIIVLATLIRQSFLVNDFPFSLIKKQAIIDQNIQHNASLKQKNTITTLKLQANDAVDMEVLESQARYRFGLVKKGERYYQVSE
ncbi:hypothetical protein MNB_SUP05-SYMBIONT-7-748 [hydrothermal vent metagenome]|uniref:Cell division protein FtsB n=1 Tax=hydrothermal vent metagenome TaxID=652676 RepID=A0A1W1E3W6_9ZZZZ